jgi:hypothetical protein
MERKAQRRTTMTMYQKGTAAREPYAMAMVLRTEATAQQKPGNRTAGVGALVVFLGVGCQGKRGLSAGVGQQAAPWPPRARPGRRPPNLKPSPNKKTAPLQAKPAPPNPKPPPSKPSRAEPTQSRPPPRRAKPSQAKPSQAKPSRAKPSQAEPSRAKQSQPSPRASPAVSTMALIQCFPSIDAYSPPLT